MRNRTALAIAHLAEDCFSYFLAASADATHMERVDWFAEFLFVLEVPVPVITYARSLKPARHAIRSALVIWVWDSYATFGIRSTDERDALFIKIAEGLLNLCEQKRTAHLARSPYVSSELVEHALRALELEGYRYLNGKLVRQDENVFDVQESSSLLQDLYGQLGLGDYNMFKHSLDNIDDHYREGRWGDCIKHARDLLETTLKQALKAYAKLKNDHVQPKTLARADAVRDKLHSMGFLDANEMEFSKALYSLLSQHGGHPNLSPKENALISRQHALTAVHFLLLRAQQLLLPPATT